MTVDSDIPKVPKKEWTRIASRHEHGETEEDLIQEGIEHSLSRGPKHVSDPKSGTPLDTSNLDPRIFPQEQPDWGNLRLVKKKGSGSTG